MKTHANVTSFPETPSLSAFDFYLPPFSTFTIYFPWRGDLAVVIFAVNKAEITFSSRYGFMEAAGTRWGLLSCHVDVSFMISGTVWKKKIPAKRELLQDWYWGMRVAFHV
ncbi:hypothetical protein CEXT_708141 [Caerostris extrusa]|uniref:Uncharacterized protein n=1 Tax=Caerostris extrusa TaxID=172846 RepID=A0AAV4NBL1_CAEEX|nr:hypothetical protein CEXT_708141 [Caerostris extrusa]